MPPQAFAARLTNEWTTAYHNVPSAALRALWTTMANTYQDAILDTAAGVPPRWRILWPPTGSGKTLGAKVYAALQAEQNTATQGVKKPVGILIVTRLDQTLAAAEAVLDRWAYFTLKGKLPTLNSSALLVPLDAPGPVVLDATAREDFIYELMGDRAVIIPTPPGVRDYSSVTLHVARITGIGKGTMVERAKTRFPRLIEDLTKRLTPDRSVFFCVHKAVEHELPDAGELPFANTVKAHWGAVDGSNEYANCDVAVIFGLPYRDRATFPNNVFFALQGPQGDDWLDQPTWKGQVNLREHMIRRQVSASVIQAINRIRCRHVTDDRGGCPPADVFIALPSGDQGDDILAAIRREMPGLQVVDWPFEPDGPKVHRRVAGTPHERLLTFMDNRAPGRTSMTAVARELGLKQDAKKDLQKNLRNENHRTTLALKALGVTYLSTGRGGKSELVKEAA